MQLTIQLLCWKNGVHLENFELILKFVNLIEFKSEIFNLAESFVAEHL